jgi:GNAT superfamily N-acetyltransferase
MAEFKLEIEYLRDHPEVLNGLAAGFKAQWPAHFADQPIEAIKLDFVSCCREKELPLALVALEDRVFCGTATLRTDSKIRPQFAPWLAQLYVPPERRRQGIGTALIRAIETEAVRHGFDCLYAATARAAPLFDRLGWTKVELFDYQGDEVTVLRTKVVESNGR